MGTARTSTISSREVSPPSAGGFSEELQDGFVFPASRPLTAKVRACIEQVARVDVPVLLLGESGVGKEVAAGFTAFPPAPTENSLSSTALLCPLSSWKASFSATRPAPSPAPCAPSPANSKCATRALSFSTRLESCPRHYRPNCSMSFKAGSFRASAVAL